MVDHPRYGLLVHGLVDQAVFQPVGHYLPQQGAPHGGVLDAGAGFLLQLLVGDDLGDANLDAGLQMHTVRSVGAIHLGHIGKDHALAHGVDAITSHVVQAQHHILGRHDYRLAVGRGQDVVGGHHQGARLQLGLQL